MRECQRQMWLKDLGGLLEDLTAELEAKGRDGSVQVRSRGRALGTMWAKVQRAWGLEKPRGHVAGTRRGRAHVDG